VTSGCAPESRLISLHSAALALRLDVAHGAEIRSLSRHADEMELLAQTPWKHAEAHVPAGPEAWTRRWPGGWQVLVPNAGNACVVDGRQHGFHGDASLEPWRVVRQSENLVEVAWSDVSGLAVVRRVELDGRRVAVVTRIVNESEQTHSLLHVEHLVFGPPLAGPGVIIAAPPCALHPLDADDGTPTGAAVQWPCVGADDWSRALDAPFTYFGALDTPQPRTIRVANEDAGVAATVDWDGEDLPHLWFWHEHAAARILDDWPLTCLGIEPASALRSSGLADAIDAHEAVVLPPGAATSAEVAVTIE
jgi:hypothetical protein